MFDNSYGWGALNFVTALVGGLICFFLILVAAALVFLLVRFLLVATVAAKIYVVKNSPVKLAQPAAALHQGSV